MCIGCARIGLFAYESDKSDVHTHMYVRIYIYRYRGKERHNFMGIEALRARQLLGVPVSGFSIEPSVCKGCCEIALA